jgi:hypothetical protein
LLKPSAPSANTLNCVSGFQPSASSAALMYDSSPAQTILGNPGKIASQLALVLNAACHNLIFSQQLHSIRSTT